jgi:hypothetical protein
MKKSALLIRKLRLGVGQERRKKSQRDGHAPQTFGALKASRRAAKPPFSGPVADAFARRESSSGPRIPFRALASAREGQKVTRETFQFRQRIPKK